MSYRAIIETLVHLDQFRNIDLFQQGFYCLKLYLYYDRDDIRVYSNPYSHYKVQGLQQHTNAAAVQAAQSRKSSNTALKLHNLRQSEVTKDNAYVTNVFYIRYADEKVDFGEMINFRTEIDMENLASLSSKDDRKSEKKNKKDEPKFFLRVELMFMEALDEEIKNPKSIVNPMTDQTFAKFQVVSQRLYQISSLRKGINDFYPISFDTMHFSSLTITVHSTLMDFKFRKQQLGEYKELAVKTMETGIRIVKLKPTVSTNQNNNQSVPKKKKKQFQNLTEFLFSEDKEDEESVGYLPIEIEIKDIERIYKTYVQQMINMYEKLKITYKKYVKVLPSPILTALIEDQNKRFQLEPPKLVITHDTPQSGNNYTTDNTYHSNLQKFGQQKLQISKSKSTIDKNASYDDRTARQNSMQILTSNNSTINMMIAPIETAAGLRNLKDVPKIQAKTLSKHKKLLQAAAMIPPKQGPGNKIQKKSGLQVNCLDNLCTKKKLDEMTHQLEQHLRKQQKDQDYINRKFHSLQKLQGFTEEDDNSIHHSLVLDEKSAENQPVNRHVITKSPSGNDFQKILDEEPLSEGFESLPEPLTNTLQNKNRNINFGYQKPPTHAHNPSHLPIPRMIESTSFINLIRQDKENNTSKDSGSTLALGKGQSFIQNYNQKVLQPKPVLNFIPQQQTIKILNASSGNSSQRFLTCRSQSHSQYQPTPKKQNKQQENPLDISQGSINFSEQKKDKGLNIPAIQVNQRNLHMINSSRSFFGIFLAQIKLQRDPHFVTKVIDNEIRQIAVQIFQIWHKLINLMCQDIKSINTKLHKKYLKRLDKFISKSILNAKQNDNEDDSHYQSYETLKSIPNTSISSNKKGNIVQLKSDQGNKTHRVNNHYSQDKLKNESFVNPLIKHKMTAPSSQLSSGSKFSSITTNNLSLSNISKIKRQREVGFDEPNSPSKVVRVMKLIDKVRGNQNQFEKIKKPSHIHNCEKKFKWEYEPLLVEDIYKKQNSDQLHSGPRALKSPTDSQKQEKQQQISDIFKQLAGKSNDKKDHKKVTSSKGIHVFVFVHGFQATSYDMRMLKNMIAFHLPKAMCLCSSANEDMTEGSIDKMGLNLATEVKKFVKDWCYSRDGKTLYMKKLTFVGHSLGGLIIRSALPQLEEFKDFMHGFMSLGSPHLGYMYNSNSLFNAGMWVLKSWKRSQCLQELSMTDHSDKKETFLYKLSKSEGLNWFKQIILCSSYQDSYAPFDSARIQICSRAAKTDKTNLYVKLAQNVIEKFNCDQLVRLDVNFKIDERNIDSMIGRTAHILLMECEPLIEMIVLRYKDFFCE